jgi:hypothetical protein
MGGDEYIVDELEPEDCATRADAKTEAQRFAEKKSREGYRVEIDDSEAGIVVVRVWRAVPSPDVDFDVDEKRFTFPVD